MPIYEYLSSVSHSSSVITALRDLKLSRTLPRCSHNQAVPTDGCPCITSLHTLNLSFPSLCCLTISTIPSPHTTGHPLTMTASTTFLITGDDLMT
ncbi:hypothetical protein E2C01_014875 [Portunus trituberculatus]|uniref:Uncharacterized protein n=1 Tax=Portunus trituberculatus TaxID=210409 RepID=A0A5B7DJW2_PORTR|nr:hypothetical protein [Portunus trituberculatus]